MNTFDKYRTTGDTHTHLSFSGGKYFVDDAQYPTFYKEYFDCLKKGEPLYLIEKVYKSKFAFFLDIELPKNVYSPDTDISDQVETIISSTHNTLLRIQNTPNESITEHLISRRNNKYHVNFPKFIVDNKTAMIIINELFGVLDPDTQKLIDRSVYNTGLRMLGSEKSHQDTERELESYGQNHELVYRICKYNTIVQFQDLDYDLFSKTIVKRPSKTRIVAIKPEYKVEKKTDKNPIVHIARPELQKELDTLFKWVYENCGGVITDHDPFEIEKIVSAKTVRGVTFYINLKNKHCFFKNREHKRDSSPIYVEISINGMYLKCYDNECAHRKFPNNNEGFALPDSFEQMCPVMYGKIHCFYKTDVTLDPTMIKLMEKSLTCTHYSVAKSAFYIYRDLFRIDDIKNTDWYKFNGVSWQKSYDMSVLVSDDLPRYYNSIKTMDLDNVQDITELKETEDSNERNKIINSIIIQLENTTFKGNVLKEMVSLFKVHDPKFVSKLDSNVDLVGFANGVYDLKKGIFRQGSVNDYITFSTGYEYVEYAPEIPQVKEIYAFLRQIITDPDVFEYLLKILGRAVSGEPDEKFFIFTGSGSNAKSTLIEFLENALGDYTTGVDASLITQKRALGSSASPDIIRTKGRRLISFAEPEHGDTLNTGVIKAMSGGDSMVARELYKAPVAFKSQATMVLCCNDLPNVTSMDGGMVRRLRVVEFKSKFCVDPNPDNPNEFKIQYDVREKLRVWRPYFMSILLHYHRLYNEEIVANGRISEPKAVLVSTLKYKKQNDLFEEFFTECLRESSNNTGKKIREIYTVLVDWWGINNVGTKVPSKKSLDQAMTTRFSSTEDLYHVDFCDQSPGIIDDEY